MPGQRIQQRELLRGDHRLRRADDQQLGELLAALGPAQANPQYGGSSVWREEG